MQKKSKVIEPTNNSMSVNNNISLKTPMPIGYRKKSVCGCGKRR
ncbi:hypothetical protein [Bacillus thuringiensis]|nr:hypothetical protein [Bacillus thuringiensis]